MRKQFVMTIEEAYKRIITASPNENRSKVKYRLGQLVAQGVPVADAYAGLNAVIQAVGLNGKRGGGDPTATEAVERTETDCRDEYGFMANTTSRWG